MRDRRPHYIRRVSTGTWPARILCASVVAQPAEIPGRPNSFTETLSQWGLCELTEANGCWEMGAAQSGTTCEPFWELASSLIQRRKVTVVYIWGAMRAVTLLGLWHLLEDKVWTLGNREPYNDYALADKPHRGFAGYCVCQDPPTIITCRPIDRSGVLRILDVRNYGDVPAQDSGSYDTTLAWTASWASSWLTMVKQLDLGSLQNTAASQAITGYRNKYLGDPVLVHCNQSALRLERESLYGGRCECFRLGKISGPVYQLDACSHYAGVASSGMAPARLAGCRDDGAGVVRDLIDAGYHIIADVYLNAGWPIVPKRHNGDLVFPTGTFWTQLAGPELLYAWRHADILDVGRIAWYEPADLFSAWCADLYSHIRLCQDRDDVLGARSAKTLLVSLFGKFAQHQWTWEDRNEKEASQAYETWYAPAPANHYFDRQSQDDIGLQPSGIVPAKPQYVRWRSVGWRVQVERPIGEHPEGCPAITSYIYSAARVKLMEWINLAGWDNVYYVDTDSVWCNQEGYENLQRAGEIRPGTLGGLRLHAVHAWVRFHGLKTYDTPHRITRAGCPTDAKATGDNQHEYYGREGLLSALRRGSGPTNIRSKIVSAPRGKYRHGHVDKLGHVTPLILREHE